jgi:hypothetical protein
MQCNRYVCRALDRGQSAPCGWNARREDRHVADAAYLREVSRYDAGGNRIDRRAVESRRHRTALVEHLPIE